MQTAGAAHKTHGNRKRAWNFPITGAYGQKEPSQSVHWHGIQGLESSWSLRGPPFCIILILLCFSQARKKQCSRKSRFCQGANGGFFKYSSHLAQDSRFPSPKPPFQSSRQHWRSRVHCAGPPRCTPRCACIPGLLMSARKPSARFSAVSLSRGIAFGPHPAAYTRSAQNG